MLSFADDAAFAAAMASEEFAAAIADAHNFQDTVLTSSCEADERIIV